MALRPTRQSRAVRSGSRPKRLPGTGVAAPASAGPSAPSPALRIMTSKQRVRKVGSIPLRPVDQGDCLIHRAPVKQQGRPYAPEMQAKFILAPTVRDVFQIANFKSSKQKREATISFDDITKPRCRVRTPASSSPSSGRNIYDYRDVGAAICRVFGISGYSYVKVVRNTPDQSEPVRKVLKGLAVLKLIQVPVPLDGLNTTEFVKRDIAHPRYKANMTFYIIPETCTETACYYTSDHLRVQDLEDDAIHEGTRVYGPRALDIAGSPEDKSPLNDAALRPLVQHGNYVTTTTNDSKALAGTSSSPRSSSDERAEQSRVSPTEALLAETSKWASEKSDSYCYTDEPGTSDVRYGRQSRTAIVGTSDTITANYKPGTRIVFAAEVKDEQASNIPLESTRLTQPVTPSSMAEVEFSPTQSHSSLPPPGPTPRHPSLLGPGDISLSHIVQYYDRTPSHRPVTSSGIGAANERNSLPSFSTLIKSLQPYRENRGGSCGFQISNLRGST